MIFLVDLMKEDTHSGELISTWQLLKSSSVTEEPFRKVERAPKSRESQPHRLSLVSFLKLNNHDGRLTSLFLLKLSSVILEKEAKILKWNHETVKEREEREKKVKKIPILSGKEASPQSAKDNEVTSAGSVKVSGIVQAQKDRG